VVRILGCKRHETVECPSVCLSHQLTAEAAAGGFAAEVGCGQQMSVDSCCCYTTSRPRKFLSGCKEVQHNCLFCMAVLLTLLLFGYFTLLAGKRHWKDTPEHD